MLKKNWKERHTKHQKTWVHINHPNVRVLIRRNHNRAIAAKYVIIHYHPGPRAHVVEQPPEYSMSMADSYIRVRRHLHHWGESSKWTKDPDYGKVGKVAT